MEPTALDELVRGGETRNVEIKGACAFDGDMRPHLTHSIGCLANTPGGGTIIVGVENNTWAVQGLSRGQIATFDATKVANYLKARLAPMPRFTIEQVVHPDGVVLLLQVPEFEEAPIMVIKQIEDSNHKVYSREGDLLIRSETRECRRINSADEMRELIARALTRQQEKLLAQIRAIMTGAAPTQPERLPEDLFASALPDWESMLAPWREQHPQCAWWEVNLLPVPALPTAVDPSRLVELIRTASVRWRGWYYPTIGVRNQVLTHKQHYTQFAYDASHHSERWQASYSGVFGSAHVVHTDLLSDLDPHRHPPAPGRLIDYIGICWSMTEFFRFATSFSEGLGCEAVWMKITLHNIEGRPLGAFDYSFGFLADNDVSSMADVAQAHMFSTAELQSAWRELALDWTKRILTVFQWPDASKEHLAAHQERLIQRQF